MGLTSQDQVDDYDPALMFTIPRLAIVAGLIMFPDGPLNLDREPRSLSELFRPFRVSVGFAIAVMLGIRFNCLISAGDVLDNRNAFNKQ